ncbi:hypothetical protein AMTRI_Chr09g40490 [Amborella trichopoda]
MHLRRNIGNTKVPAPSPIVSPSTPPPVPTKPMVELAPAPAPSVTQKALQLLPVHSLMFPQKCQSDGSNAYVIVASPTVGKIRTGRTVKGKAVGYGDPLIAVLPSFHGKKVILILSIHSPW